MQQGAKTHGRPLQATGQWCPSVSTPLPLAQASQPLPPSCCLFECTLPCTTPVGDWLSCHNMQRVFCCAMRCHAPLLSCAGEGMLRMEDAVRQRIACAPTVNATVATLNGTPRPPAFPGIQRATVVDYWLRGRLYPDSVLAQDVVMFLSPGDVEDAAYYAGGCCDCCYCDTAAGAAGSAACSCKLQGPTRGQSVSQWRRSPVTAVTVM
jgi:hypothetical protein